MKGRDFPIFKTKIDNIAQVFDLSSPVERKKYFQFKAGPEIEKIKKYLDQGKTFIAYLLGKKNSGKGTYSKLFMEAVGSDKVGHLSVGDLVRDIHKSLEIKEERKILIEFLNNNYRGPTSPEEAVNLILNRSTSGLISSELVLALMKFEISKRSRQAIFIDGFPRALDQVGHSLYLKELIGYREDPDFFVFIDVPNAVIKERIKTRVICPICQTPRSLKLLATKEVGFDKEHNTFYLICDNPSCNGRRMVPKEGDELGLEPIRERLEIDDKIFEHLLLIHGISKIYLRNSLPIAQADEYVDDYEITPSYQYQLDQEFGKVNIISTKWIIKDDQRIESYSLLPAAVTLALIKQIAILL